MQIYYWFPCFRLFLEKIYIVHAAPECFDTSNIFEDASVLGSGTVFIYVVSSSRTLLVYFIVQHLDYSFYLIPFYFIGSTMIGSSYHTSGPQGANHFLPLLQLDFFISVLGLSYQSSNFVSLPTVILVSLVLVFVKNYANAGDCLCALQVYFLLLHY